MNLLTKTCPQCGQKSLTVSYYKDTYICNNCGDSNLIAHLNENKKLILPSIVLQNNLQSKYFSHPISLMIQHDDFSNGTFMNSLLEPEIDKSELNKYIFHLDDIHLETNKNSHKEALDYLADNIADEDIFILYISPQCVSHIKMGVSFNEHLELFRSLLKFISKKTNIIINNFIPSNKTFSYRLKSLMSLIIKTNETKDYFNIDFLKCRYRMILSKNVQLSKNNSGDLDPLKDLIRLGCEVGLLSEFKDQLVYLGDTNILTNYKYYTYNDLYHLSVQQKELLHEEVLKKLIKDI